ncbi:BZ3500_MvSof-1268-A1-R1_Chr5-2g07927 [Microbotryum saponariae]|uniref:BZ3500_MvSof-1268-A1-R1_Chr5-2g07927 protein n=1 Tax=Microbotryum saponariae TaxID=289078 RepID=A0A2X0KGW0_9BASI|nr:BZ3500_MvSof-1268-A1-R1_Chr5-2g07927 [Microbotryum saponariae]SDA05796.1 BZ3501_MvSof-1269-A2-R1_Chr5-2g07749 [Microbotryum saponariae]
MNGYDADSFHRPAAPHPSQDRTQLWGPTTATTSRPPAYAPAYAPSPALVPAPVDFNHPNQRPSTQALNTHQPQASAHRPEVQVGDFGEDPQLEAIRRESVQIEKERQARFRENEQTLLRTLAESQRVDERRSAEEARADQLLRQALEESQRGKTREAEEEELQMVLAMSLSEHEFATTSAQRFAQLSHTSNSISPDDSAQASNDTPHSLFQNVIVDASNINGQQPAAQRNPPLRRASLYDSFTNPDELVSPPAYAQRSPMLSSALKEVNGISPNQPSHPIDQRASDDTVESTDGAYLPAPQRAPSSVPPSQAPASAFYSGAVAGAMIPNTPPIDRAHTPTHNALLPYPALSLRRSSHASISELLDGHNSVRLSVLSTTSVAGSWASEASDDTLDDTRATSQSLSCLSEMHEFPMEPGPSQQLPHSPATETGDDDIDPFDDRFASVDGDDLDANLPMTASETDSDLSFASSFVVQDRDMFDIARRLSKESMSRPSLSIVAPVPSAPESAVPEPGTSSSHAPDDRDEALAKTPTHLDVMDTPSPPPQTSVRPPLSRDGFPNDSGASVLPTSPDASYSASSSTDVLDAYRTNPSSGGLVIDATAGGVALATEDIVEGVRWGFVPVDKLAQHPPLKHDGPFQKAAQLSTYTDEGAHQRPYECFAIEASSWHRLLCYLMWFGLSQFEAAPYDHAALTKDHRHFEVSVLVQFFRSFEDRSPRVRCLVQILPLARASAIDTAPTRRSQSRFDVSCPNISIPIDADPDRPLHLPLTLATLGSALSKAHTISSRLGRSTFGAPTSRGGTVMEKTLASAVIFCKQLNGDFATASPEADDFERSTLERLKLRLKRARGKRVGVQGRMEGGRDDVPEEASLITPFILEETEDGC